MNLYNTPETTLSRSTSTYEESPSSNETRYQAVCVCGGYGFPMGTSGRICMVGKALQEAGVEFRLLHCGPSPTAANTDTSGTYEGINFEYTTSIRRPDNRLARLFVYLRGVIGLTSRLARLRPARRRTVIYLYLMDGPINLYVGYLCRFLGFALVQELCEWWPGTEDCSAFTSWLYKSKFFTLATGTLVISRTIEQRVREKAERVNPGLLIYRLPVIVEAEKCARAAPLRVSRDQRLPRFVYCGTWMSDVFFLIRAFALVRRSGYRCKLSIIGVFFRKGDPTITQYAMENGLLLEDMDIPGGVDEATLHSCYKSATALLMPLWDDDRSKTRLPNKMGEYLASGRPVITNSVGDLTEFLRDEDNAYIVAPDDERAYANKMISVLNHPVRADQVGLAGQRACFEYLDYRAHAQQLSGFFVSCIERHNEVRS